MTKPSTIRKLKGGTLKAQVKELLANTEKTKAPKQLGKGTKPCLLSKLQTNANGDLNGLMVAGKVTRPARMAWEFTLGKKVPNGQKLMNICGNKICIEPSHFALRNGRAHFAKGGKIIKGPAGFGSFKKFIKSLRKIQVEGEEKPCLVRTKQHPSSNAMTANGETMTYQRYVWNHHHPKYKTKPARVLHRCSTPYCLEISHLYNSTLKKKKYKKRTPKRERPAADGRVDLLAEFMEEKATLDAATNTKDKLASLMRLTEIAESY